MKPYVYSAARAVIAADRALRQDDDALTIAYMAGSEYTKNQCRAALAAKDAEIAALKAERDALSKDALTAAVTAFGLVVSDCPEELPADAQALAAWITQRGPPSAADDVGPEELFLHIIRAAMTKGTEK